MSWRLLDFEGNAYEMYAALRAIVNEVVEQRSPNTVIFSHAKYVGLGTSSVNTINIEECKKIGIPVVQDTQLINYKGPSTMDGGPIWLPIVYRYEDTTYPSDCLIAVDWLIEVIINVCKHFGLEAERSRHRPRSNDIVVKTKKISGVSADKYGDSMIMGSSFLSDFDFKLADKILKIPRLRFMAKPHYTSKGWPHYTLEDQLMTLRKALGREVPPAEVKEVFIKVLERKFEMKLIKSGLTEREEEQFKELLPTFTSDQHNFGKNIGYYEAIKDRL